MKPATFSVANIAERSSELEFELLCTLAKSTACEEDAKDAKDAIDVWYKYVGAVLTHAHGTPTQEELEYASQTISELWEELRRAESKAKKAKLAVE